MLTSGKDPVVVGHKHDTMIGSQMKTNGMDTSEKTGTKSSVYNSREKHKHEEQMRTY
jgi:hypothetical protein